MPEPGVGIFISPKDISPNMTHQEGKGGERGTRGFPMMAEGLGNFLEYDIIDQGGEGVLPARIFNSDRGFEKRRGSH